VTFASEVGIGLSEPTLTELNLIEIRRRFPSHALTWKFTNVAEGTRSGADWAWCIGDGDQWITLLVQAKLAHGDRLPELHGDGTQWEKLTSFAHNEGALPLYCIYFGGTAPGGPCGLLASPGQAGCMFVSADHVGRMRRKREVRLDTALSAALPWACIACCGEEGDDLVGSVARGLSRLAARAGRTTVRPEDLITEHVPDFFMEAIKRIARNELPHDRAPSRSALATMTRDALSWQYEVVDEHAAEDELVVQRG
jgi:hypothetical protein